MKIIFLDIDGVLNSNRTAVIADQSVSYTDSVAHTRAFIDPIAVKLVEALAERTDAHIVVSSTHRLPFLLAKKAVTVDGEKGTMSFFCDLIGIREYMSAAVGLSDVSRVIGCTSSIHLMDSCRGDEIKQWLDTEWVGEVTHYVIIDDDSDMLEDQMEHFVKVPHEDGLSFKNIERCFQILEAEML